MTNREEEELEGRKRLWDTRFPGTVLTMSYMRPSPVITLSYLYFIAGNTLFLHNEKPNNKSFQRDKQTGWGQRHSLTEALLPGWPDALKDSRFPHGIEFFHGVVLLVEVSVGLFPGLRHPVLRRRTRGGFSSQAQRKRNIAHFIVKSQLHFIILP